MNISRTPYVYVGLAGDMFSAAPSSLASIAWPWATIAGSS